MVPDSSNITFLSVRAINSTLRMHALLIVLGLCISSVTLHAEDGYQLWLRYEKISDQSILKHYTKTVRAFTVEGNSPTLALAKQELALGLSRMLGKPIAESQQISAGTILIGTAASPRIQALGLTNKMASLGNEGFIIYSTVVNKKNVTVITAQTDLGVLYGTFHFLKLLQTQQSLEKLDIVSIPKVKIRVLNHWDNLDRTVERGYAGFSLWNWHTLPDYKDPRYAEYARANASIGINGTVLTNVNANALVLTEPYLKKAAALADIFRPYGVKVYLTARFSAPIEIGNLKTADPLDPAVQAWWKKKADEIYTHIPDFGGFLVKANSEGQPGPQNYGRSHVEGANMLADAVQPHGGMVMWRAFVYDDKVPDDRARQAYTEFKPLDGKFRDNVLVQVKNGAIDFQPREPFHPLFGAMPKTPLMMEFQITQEYLGFSTHLVYLASLFKETLDADTHTRGKNSTVAKVIDGSLDNHQLTGIAGVANIGTDRNWTGHPFAQANWYTFGRLAWDHTLSAENIADEWIRMTFSNEAQQVSMIKSMMLGSHEAVVRYMTPLGLHHIMGWSHHYGPAPWIDKKHRADWTSVYYHKADSLGIGFNRTKSGSNALGDYAPAIQHTYEQADSIPEKYLLWFHHVAWNQKLKSGNTLWNELCLEYQRGVDSVRTMQQTWRTLNGKIDVERYESVDQLLSIQVQEAVWWRNVCLLYFQQFSKLPLPAGVEKPDHPLSYYQQLEFPFAPGIKPTW
jgi:alpha-glucuronidase